jgi:hypothetical protein
MLELGSIHPSPSSPRVGAVLTGACEIPLERAVLPYRSIPDAVGTGGRVHDLGLGVVLEVSGASRARVVDLGSGEIRDADLTPPVVLLGWVFPRTFREIQVGVAGSISPGDRRHWSRQFAFPLLRELGLSALTRPTFLRLGFLDLCQDLDLHDEAAIRMHLGASGAIRAHLEPETSQLILRTGKSAGLPELEGALSEAFPLFPLSRRRQGEGRLTVELSLALPLRTELPSLRRDLASVRAGFESLLRLFEPERFDAYRSTVLAFGARDSLAALDWVVGSRPRGEGPGGRAH